MSARIWRGISPVLFQQTADQQITFGLTPEMVQSLVVCIIAHLFLYFYILAYRTRLDSLRDQLVELRRARAQ
jgi:hypothetical protein